MTKPTAPFEVADSDVAKAIAAFRDADVVDMDRQDHHNMRAALESFAQRTAANARVAELEAQVSRLQKAYLTTERTAIGAFVSRRLNKVDGDASYDQIEQWESDARIAAGATRTMRGLQPGDLGEGNN